MVVESCLRCGRRSLTQTNQCAYCLLQAGSEYDYRTLNVLGRGVHGTVYVAERLPGARLVALKVLDRHQSDEVVVRVSRCKAVLGALGHPSIVRIVDIGRNEREDPYIASDYVRGIPIDSYCRRFGIDRETRQRLLESVDDLVRSSHAAGVTHGGIGPSNVFVVRTSAGPSVRVMDFGLRAATEADDAAAFATLTRTVHQS